MQEVAAALAELGEATCVELGLRCSMASASVNAALLKLRADKKVHVERWTDPKPKGASARVWVLGPGEDAPRPAKAPRVRKQPLFFSTATEAHTPNLPTSYAFKSVFVGDKNPWR